MSYPHYFRSNFENLIKLQLNNNLSASSFYTNLVNHHYQQQQQQNHLRQSILNQHHLHQNTSSQPANFFQLPTNAQAFTTQVGNNNNANSNQESVCCDQKSNCNHRQELASLRDNILKLLSGIMPQYVSMAGLESSMDVHCSELSDSGKAHIDRMVDSLVQQINTA